MLFVTEVEVQLEPCLLVLEVGAEVEVEMDQAIGIEDDIMYWRLGL